MNPQFYVVVQVTTKIMDGAVAFPEITFVTAHKSKKKAIEMQNLLSRQKATTASFFKVVVND